MAQFDTSIQHAVVHCFFAQSDSNCLNVDWVAKINSLFQKVSPANVGESIAFCARWDLFFLCWFVAPHCWVLCEDTTQESPAQDPSLSTFL